MWLFKYIKMIKNNLYRILEYKFLEKIITNILNLYNRIL